MSAPDISVIMPIYNADPWIRQAMDCICLNSHKNLEIICVLDAPTDGSDEVIKGYAKTDSRIIVVEQKENKGQGHARNVGFKRAKGEWIHFMDSDDLINIDFYKNMLAATKFADVDAVLCSDILHENMQKRVSIFAPMFMSNFGDISKITNGALSTPWGWMFNRNFLNRINFQFPEDMIVAEDYIAMGDVINKANRICTAKDTTYLYKYRRNSVVTKKSQLKRRKSEFCKGRLFVNELSKQSGGEPLFEIDKIKSYFRNRLLIKYYINGDKEILFSWRTAGKRVWKI